MKLSKLKLSRQLLVLVAVAFALLFTYLGVVLPKVLLPVTEANLYNYLSEPLKLVDSEMDEKLVNTEIAYLYVIDKKEILISDNFNDVIKVNDVDKLLK